MMGDIKAVRKKTKVIRQVLGEKASRANKAKTQVPPLNRMRYYTSPRHPIISYFGSFERY
ncbi:Uncharacterised protein [uncultured archaeon]|nr:Uncharacterised protein [uncultured archaeon]